ncbi:MAG TPA: element excision factor XisH family protein [Blastocatellia bacterium]|nr:element excision factor XisH family protein [Blastocatellia bacterium]
MPAKDLYHDIVVAALTAEGWTITDDPFYLSSGKRDLWIDLGAECQTIGAERQGQRIAVEIKSFLSRSPVEDLQEAIGQYGMYRELLADSDPDRTLYLAVPKSAYSGIFSEELGQLMIERLRLRLIVFEVKTERVIKWIS